MVVYCTDTLTNDGIISMTARGAYAEGQNLYLFRQASGGGFIKVDKVGGDGGADVRNDANGLPGKLALNLSCGGGGSRCR